MKPRPRKLMAALAMSWLLWGARVEAQVTSEPSAVVFPDPAKFAHGLYTEGELGAVAFFGPAGHDVAPGFAVGARVGYDLWSWLAVQAHFLGSTHSITGDSPQAGQLLQTYQAIAEGKLTWRFGQTSIFGEGGAGLERLSTNVLYTLMIERYRIGLTAGGGGGFDYHSLSRHFSVGVRGDFFWLREISDSRDLMATTYLRYTF
ncbi:MAG TPA: hypothetical protein VFG23_16520 [Polyangia bacterium]|nr:hypothetical protein [Polyangia bacterium]